MYNGVSVIAYCATAKQYYRLRLDRDEKTILDFSISRKKAVHMEKFPLGKRMTADACLRACPVCGNRVAANCTCIANTLPCEKSFGFRFPCVYCTQLKMLGIERE